MILSKTNQLTEQQIQLPFNHKSLQTEMQKQKNITSNLKRLSTNIESNRKGIESNSHVVENINELKSTFNDIEGIIKGQTASIDGIKTFSKQSTTQTSKNLQSKRIFTSIVQRYKQQIRAYIELASQNFLISYKENSGMTWQKIQKDIDKSIMSVQQQSQTTEQMFESLQKISSAKEFIISQTLKLMIYQKNILWRDLNAPYDDYIHGQVKSMINQIKSNEEKFGYIPSRLKFQIPKFVVQGKNDAIQLFKIHLGDFSEIVQGLKNYAKLSGQDQVIEDISKNQHIVKGLRERIQKLSINYQGLMQKYRNLQISKGKLTQNQEKSLTEKLEELQTLLMRKQQQIIEFKQSYIKGQTTIQSLRDKTKELEQQLSKFNKYQMPKIKQLQLNQKSILDQFIKVRRDLETYSNIVNVEREEKLKLVEDVKDEKKRVNELAFILGRERRKIKELKQQINRKQQIIMELVDQKLPE